MTERGQTNIFDDVLKENESFVIVVQEVMDNNGALTKRSYVNIQARSHSNEKSL